MPSHHREMPYVVVGVDGSEDNLGALRYAVDRARALGASVRVVHVVPDGLPIAAMAPQAMTDLTEVGAAILQRSIDRLRAIDPDATVEGRLRHGTRSVQLGRSAEQALLLVVGRDERRLAERLRFGDTATRVAARATVPVVEVPADWQPDPRGTVVVGVKDSKYADHLLLEAFEEARRRDANLVVLHAWKLPTVYDDIVEARVDLDAWDREATLWLEELLQDCRASFPEVEVELKVVHDHAGRALVEAAKGADLLVILRRAHGVPAAIHLGGTARAVLRSAGCPVQVMAPSDAMVMPGLVLEQAGSPVK